MNAAKIKLMALFAFLACVVALGIFGMAVSARSAAAPSGEGFTTKKPVEEARSITLSPCGTVVIKKVPERVVTLDANYNDMLEAFGKGSALLATGAKNNFFDGFYQQLPGVKISIPYDKLVFMFGDNTGNAFDKEFFYKMKADIHHIDPMQLARMKGWTKADVDEIARNVGPFLANRFSRENRYDGEGEYKFYDIWELSGKIAEAYYAEGKVARIKELAERMSAKIKAKLPPEDQRPLVALLYYGNGKFTPYSLEHAGFGQAQYRELGLKDAFAAKKIKTYGEGQLIATSMDLEGLAAVNPEIIIMPFGIYTLQCKDSNAASSFKQLTELKENPIAKKVKAFQSGKIYLGGTPLQGPVFYVFQLEMAAKQVYPELFGQYRDDQAYAPEERLFSREELAAILLDKGAPK